jgi:hypothetical protein
MLKMLKKVEIERTLLQTMLKMLKKVNTNNVEKTRKKSHPKPQTGHSPGGLLVKRQNESPGRTVARTNPGFRVWGSSWRKESLAPIFALLNIPQSVLILRTKKNYKQNCCSFSARKHPTPPGTGTEPGALSGLGAAPAPGSRQFSQALLAVGPPEGTDPREKNPGMPQARTRAK